MSWNPPPADPRNVVQIICHELPTRFERDEGDYELRWGHNPEEVFYHDIVSLKKELSEVIPDRVDDVLDRLQNFRSAYLNLSTGEIFSGDR